MTLLLTDAYQDHLTNETRWREQTTQLINRFGWKLCGVSGDDTQFPFIYTLGNYGRGLPELLMIGPPNGHILNSICALMRRRNRCFKKGELIDLPGCEFALKAVNGNDEARMYAWQVDRYYGSNDYSVQQILISDNSGRFPDDPECQEPYRLVPILTGKTKQRKGILPDFGRIQDRS